jgi:hypothetical protein
VEELVEGAQVNFEFRISNEDLEVWPFFILNSKFEFRNSAMAIDVKPASRGRRVCAENAASGLSRRTVTAHFVVAGLALASRLHSLQ